jgi:hypothetical protein
VRLWLAALCLIAVQAWAADDTRVLDDFADAAAWQATASEDVKAEALRAPDGGLCLRYDFGHVSGYAVLRRALPIEFPQHHAVVLRLRGSGPANAFQFKLVDASGDNVWWLNRPGYTPPAASTDLVIRQRQIEFAWGPTANRTLERAASIELVVASGEGGRGELCFERLSLRTLPAPSAQQAVASASESSAEASRAFDGNAQTAWRVPGGTQHWQVDFGAPRELNGLLLRWADGRPASDFDVQFSDDGMQWRTVRQVRGSTRELLPLWLPDSETRFVRLLLQRGPAAGYALAEVQAPSPGDWPTLNAVLDTMARAAPRGLYPRAFVGEQNYWTLAGVDRGGAHAALVSEDGAIEPRRAGPSFEPFVIDEDGAIASWADVRIEHALRDGYLPLPQVRWRGSEFALSIEAGADGTQGNAQLVTRYTLTNTSSRPRSWTLALALRPWQVNPPTQFLNTVGGASRVRQVEWQRDTLRVDGRSALVALSAPQAVGAALFERGDAVELAARGALPALTRIDDAQGLASVVLRWQIALAPGASRSVDVVLPLAGTAPTATANAAARLDAIAAAWRRRLNRVTLELPPVAQPLADSLRSALAHILMSRDGAALQPGTRSYARSWVRDGAMMIAGLLRLGEVDASREFVQWYAQHLFANGKVPCCVDARGADPVAENDSHGQFIHAVAELWRHTGDRALVDALWPQVEGAARYMEQLRQSERTAANQQPGNEAFYGLMPASISHEGYAAKPMHSYWDDFWALAGYRDAVRLARLLGRDQRAVELARQRDEFATDLAASLTLAVSRHRIDYLPGAAELGDFDPSSSTMIFSPAGAETLVPRALLESTWERYWQESVARRDGRRAWSDYTPYELRSVSALLRLQQPGRAHALLEYFLRDQRPAGWNQWAEVVGREAREPRFVGDMPHAWISSDYIRSMLDLLAYERASDGALVLGAGVTEAWLQSGPVALRGLRTACGNIDFRLERESAQVLRLRIAPCSERPPGGSWFAWAGNGKPPATTVDGRPLDWKGPLLQLPDGAVDLRMRLATPGD